MKNTIKMPTLRLTVANKLIAGFTFLVGVAGVLGVLSLFFITQIDKTLNQITDVNTPIVETSDDLVMNVLEATQIAQEGIANEGLSDLDLLLEEFRGLAGKFDVSYQELDELVDDDELLDELTKVRELHVKFMESSAHSNNS